MPYNTRRKSLSLPALGIHVPSTSRAHRPSISRPSQDDDSPQHPSKRVKRSHTASSGSATSPVEAPSSAIPITPKTVTFADRPKSSGRNNTYDHTPPPSPGPSHATKIDKEGINDDLVVGVLEQLEKTGNRPHLIKELAAVLATSYDAVATSANAPALLSSRLASYMRRPWTALSPCPVAKELIPIHPRKVFYYLTTCPRQELAPNASDILPVVVGGSRAVVGKGKDGPKRIISPSLSNASQDDDDPSAVEDRKRAALSPSPEIDLSLDLELGDLNQHVTVGTATDFPTSAGSSFSSAGNSLGPGGSLEGRDLDLNRRAQSPRLEGDEREFTDTARGMRLRGLHVEEANEALNKVKGEEEMDMIETEEEKAKKSSEAAATLFGTAHTTPARGLREGSIGLSILSSPFAKPMAIDIIGLRRDARIKQERDFDDVIMDEDESSPLDEKMMFDEWDARGPEDVELDELDGLFEEY